VGWGTDSNWLVRASNYVYLINICHALNKQEVRAVDGTVRECVAGDEVQAHAERERERERERNDHPERLSK
jgi:hypothetical protein